MKPAIKPSTSQAMIDIRQILSYSYLNEARLTDMPIRLRPLAV
jgi:hypothetical protein